MELDLQSLFGLHVHSCTHRLRPLSSPTPSFGLIGRYWSAKIDDISLWPPGRKLPKEKYQNGVMENKLTMWGGGGWLWDSESVDVWQSRGTEHCTVLL